MIKFYVFDIGNVIWEFRPLFDQLFLSWSILADISFNDFRNEYEKVYLGFETGQTQIEDWFKVLAPSVDPKDFMKKIDDIFGNADLFNSYLDKNMLDLIKTIQESGLKVACLSNTENFIGNYFKKYIEPYFDYSILSWAVHQRKPNPEIYQNIFQYGDYKPEEIIFIDDKPENVEAAQKLGINGIIFKNYLEFKPIIDNYLVDKLSVSI